MIAAVQSELRRTDFAIVAVVKVDMSENVRGLGVAYIHVTIAVCWIVRLLPYCLYRQTVVNIGSSPTM